MVDTLTKVGVFKQRYNINLNTNLPCLDIVQSSGLIVHIHKETSKASAVFKQH